MITDPTAAELLNKARAEAYPGEKVQMAVVNPVLSLPTGTKGKFLQLNAVKCQAVLDGLELIKAYLAARK